MPPSKEYPVDINTMLKYAHQPSNSMESTTPKNKSLGNNPYKHTEHWIKTGGKHLPWKRVTLLAMTN